MTSVDAGLATATATATAALTFEWLDTLIWLWSDLHLSDPSVLLGWCRPYRSVEQMNRHAALPPGMYKRNARRHRYPCLQVLLLVFDRDVIRSVQSHMHRLDTSRPAAVVSERESAIVETVRRLHGLPSTRTLAA